ncbi:hypothetical protein Prudu_009335 [Prunus dulcis]|uniref:Uncharacterized protein n=1 Tax=Prunus dulcis TaxID=3755 RepID=A0A4Y1R6I5_PRUDU|nr:hypothetical protein Prudu_009335 [Prunus dulcis]
MGRLSLFLAYVAFGFFNSPNTGEECWLNNFLGLANFEAQNVGVNNQLFTFCYMFVLQSADLEFPLLKNTRKVFSEYHNVPMDTHKVFTALVQWGSCRSPSVIHNREQFGAFSLLCSLPPLVPFYRLRGTDKVEPVMASRTVWVGVTSHYSHPSTYMF